MSGDPSGSASHRHAPTVHFEFNAQQMDSAPIATIACPSGGCIINATSERCPLVPEMNDSGASVSVPVSPVCRINSTDSAKLHQRLSNGPRSIMTEVFAGSWRLESQRCDEAGNFVIVLQ